MPTNNDWYEALLEGRWRPEIEVGVAGETKNPYFYAKYMQGDKEVKRTSVHGPLQAEDDLMSEIRRGVLEGEYYPEG